MISIPCQLAAGWFNALIMMLSNTIIDTFILIKATIMLRKAPAMTVRQNLGELLNEVQYRHDSILITKADKPVAALVDINLFNRIRLLQKEFDRLSDELAAAYASVDADAAIAEIDEAVDAARRL